MSQCKHVEYSPLALIWGGIKPCLAQSGSFVSQNIAWQFPLKRVLAGIFVLALARVLLLLSYMYLQSVSLHTDHHGAASDTI